MQREESLSGKQGATVASKENEPRREATQHPPEEQGTDKRGREQGSRVDTSSDPQYGPPAVSHAYARSC